MKAVTVLSPPPDDVRRQNMPRALGFLLQLAIFDSLISFNSTVVDDGSLGRQLLWGGLGLTALIYIVVTRLVQPDKKFVFGGWPVAILLLYVFASTAWSVTPMTTIKRAIVLAFLVALCGISIGSRTKNWRKDLFSTSLVTPLAWIILLGVLVTVIAPGRAFTDIGWRGMSGQKNLAGQMVAVTLLFLLYGVCREKMGKRLRITLILFTFGLLLLSKSTTALLGLVLGIGATELFTLRTTMRRLASWQLAVAGTLLTASTLLYFAFVLQILPSASELYVKALGVLGKSETFTGRTAIWNLVLSESRFHNSWIGGGYGGFWVGRDSISGYVVVGADLYPGQAHNGYIDIYNDLGIVGLWLLATVVVVGLYRARRVFALDHTEGKIHVAITLLCIFTNLGESTFFRGTQFLNIIFLASFIRTTCILVQAHEELKQPDVAEDILGAVRVVVN